MTIYFLIVFGFYFLLLLCLFVGWRKSDPPTGDLSVESKFISIVIAMRNERTNIESLLESLASQNYSQDHFEIILVDDHSEDGSVAEAKKWSPRIPSLKIISLAEKEKGKKTALSTGIGIAKGELIATTDADCIVPRNWLTRIDGCFCSAQTKMCVGAVALQHKNWFFDKLQSIEFASVIGTSISLAVLGRPVMCNGANLSFRKKIFDDVGGYRGNEHIASGDDEFLMRKIDAKYPGSIVTMKDCIVTTKPQPTLKGFIRQRLRWASKWKYNSSFVARLLAVFVFVVQVSYLTLAAFSAFCPSEISIAMVMSKVMVEWLVLSAFSSSLGMKFNLLAFATLQLLYPFYVLCIGIFSHRKNHQWKGRRI